MATELDPESEDRLRRLAEARQSSPEMLLREAAEQFLAREETQEKADPDRHPSGRPWPSRNPVGGIITPA